MKGTQGFGRDAQWDGYLRQVLGRVALVLLAFVAACAPPVTTAGSGTPSVIHSYRVGVEATVEVGAPIVTLTSGFSQLIFTARREIAIGSGGPPVRAGQVFRVMGRLNDGRLIVDHQGNMVPLVVDSAGHVHGKWYELSGVSSVTSPADTTPPFRADMSIEGPGVFRIELIYTGIDGDGAVHALYREYSDDLARPAFSHPIRYSLAADSVVGFRTLRFRIFEATSAHIRFEVIEDGGLPWLPHVH